MTYHTKWSDAEIREWAYAYVGDKSASLIDLEDRLGVSHSTIWWCFQHRLRNKALTARVFHKLKHKAGRHK